MATKPSDFQLFYKKSKFKSKHLPYTKDHINILAHITFPAPDF